MLNIVNIRKCGSVVGDDLNPEVKVRGSKHSFLQPIIPRPRGLGWVI